MVKKWSEVINSPEYQALDAVQQAEAQNQYFTSVISPQVPAQDMELAYQQFTTEFPLATGGLSPEEYNRRQVAVAEHNRELESKVRDREEARIKAETEGKSLVQEAIDYAKGAYKGLQEAIQGEDGLNTRGMYTELTESGVLTGSDPYKEATNISNNIWDYPEYKGMSRDEIYDSLRKQDAIDTAALTAGVVVAPASIVGGIATGAVLEGATEALKGATTDTGMSLEDTAKAAARGAVLSGAVGGLGKLVSKLPASDEALAKLRGRDTLAELSGTAPVRTFAGQVSDNPLSKQLTERTFATPFVGRASAITDQANELDTAINALVGRTAESVVRQPSDVPQAVVDDVLSAVPNQLADTITWAGKLADRKAINEAVTKATQGKVDADSLLVQAQASFDSGNVLTIKGGKPHLKPVTSSDVRPTTVNQVVDVSDQFVPTQALSVLDNAIASKGLDLATKNKYVALRQTLTNVQDPTTYRNAIKKVQQSFGKARSANERALYSTLDDALTRSAPEPVQAVAGLDSLFDKAGLASIKSGDDFYNALKSPTGFETVSQLIEAVPATERATLNKALVSKYLSSAANKSKVDGRIDAAKLANELKNNKQILDLVDTGTKKQYEDIIAFIDSSKKLDISTQDKVYNSMFTTVAPLMTGGLYGVSTTIGGAGVWRLLNSKAAQNQLNKLTKLRGTPYAKKAADKLESVLTKSSGVAGTQANRLEE